MKIRIEGTGLYVPGRPIDNEELKILAGIDFDGVKLEEKIGIRQRYIAKLRGIGETTADFAEKAARNALTDAGRGTEDIDFIILATDTPEFITPASSIVVQGRLQQGQRPILAFDIGASCAGFVTAFDTAARILDSNPRMSCGIVIGVYNMPAFVREGDAFGRSIFADGAGAVVLSKGGIHGSRYIHGAFLTDGTQWDYVGVYAGGTRKPVTEALLKSGAFGLELLKNLPGDRNLKLWPPLLTRLCREAGWETQDLAHVIFTQINRSVILAVMEILGFSSDKTTMVMDRYGYTGSACVPMALHHGIKEGRIKRGDIVALVASGAGLTVGGNLFVY